MQVKVLLIFLTLLSFQNTYSQIVKTSSTYNGEDEIIGTGYIVAGGSKFNQNCENAVFPEYSNCRYFLVTAAHHFDGENKKVCNSNETNCFSITRTIINASNDIAIAEIRPSNKFKPFARLLNGKLVSTLSSNENILNSNRTQIYHDYTTFKKYRMLPVGDSQDSNSFTKQPIVPLASWVGTMPSKYQQDESSSILARKLAVSGNWVLPAQIRPGQSGSPLLVATDYSGQLFTVSGNAIRYNRFARESIFTSEDKIIKLLKELYAGKSGRIGLKYRWYFDKSVPSLYRKSLDGRHIEYDFHKVVGDVSELNELFKNIQKPNDEILILKKPDLNSIKVNEMIKLDSFKNKPEINKVKSKFLREGSGNGTYGDGGDLSSYKGDSVTAREGMIYDKRPILGFRVNVANRKIPIFANWEAVELINQRAKKSLPIDSESSLLEMLHRRLGSNSCRTDLVCESVRDIKFCASLEVEVNNLKLNISKDNGEIEQINLNFDQLSSLHNYGSGRLYVDYKELFFVDLMNVFTKANKTVDELITESYERGPAFKISFLENGDKAGSYPIKFEYENCK